MPEHYIQYLEDVNAASRYADLRDAIDYFNRKHAKERDAAKRKKEKLGGIRTGRKFRGGNKFELFNFTVGGNIILITPTQTMEYFGLGSGQLSRLNRAGTSGRGTLYEVSDVYQLAKERRSCKGETPMQALKRFKYECGR